MHLVLLLNRSISGGASYVRRRNLNTSVVLNMADKFYFHLLNKESEKTLELLEFFNSQSKSSVP